MKIKRNELETLTYLRSKDIEIDDFAKSKAKDHEPDAFLDALGHIFLRGLGTPMMSALACDEDVIYYVSLQEWLSGVCKEVKKPFVERTLEDEVLLLREDIPDWILT